MYKKVTTDLNFAQRELEILDFWRQSDIFCKTKELRKDAPVFSFYEGPPTANGLPHLGHVITRAIKDIIPRYKVMKGYNVLRKAGWDTHGLPVELEVERQLKISGKTQIEEYGIEAFIEKCKESVWKYKDEWEKMSERVGFWVDMQDPYVTYHNSYIESIWWALKTIWEKGLLYKGHKILPYCGRCGTSLSSHEVAQGYKDITETSVIAQFKVKNKNEYILAWTTTPWTLPSNVALCVNPIENYVRVSYNDNVYIMAQALLNEIFLKEYKVLEVLKGKQLEYLEYEPLFDFVNFDIKSHYIVCDNYVTLTDGTGVVHQAPAFGEDDNRVAKVYGLPFVQLVDNQGCLTKETPWGGVFVKEADPHIIEYMRKNGLLFKQIVTEHNYPHCWRCETPLIYYARSAWFIQMSKLRGELLKNNANVNWLPENIGSGRFGNFLDNVIDWGLSRERYWGTPLPIWECGCGYTHAVGSVEELSQMSEVNFDNLDLHKPSVDKIKLKCPKCNGKMTRVPEVIDCWFDSGAMPFAQFHYPFENKELFERNFPAEFISEGVDQTRGWFYTQMAISTLLFDKNPYKNVIVLGHSQDEKGQKMSKSKGNVVPWNIMDIFGADTLRWYFYTNHSPWLPTRYSEEAMREVQRKFLGTLWNTYAFYVLYADIDNFDPQQYKLDIQNLCVLDKWILSGLNSLIKMVDEGLENYKITETARQIAKFTDDLSNWYVRRSRERFWASSMTKDKIDAYMTLYTVLTELCKLASPYVPFITELIYQNLVVEIDKNAEKSIHLCDFPIYVKELINNELEKNMQATLDIVILGRAARNIANIKNRQPLSSILIEGEHVLPKQFCDIIKEELNIKEISFVSGLSKYTSHKLKPQLKTLGPKYGKILPKISSYLTENSEDVWQKLQNGAATLAIDGVEIELLETDVLVEVGHKEGYISEADSRYNIVISTTLNDELIEEGFLRELISKIQTMRKDAGFEVMDNINLYHGKNPKLEKIISKNSGFIASEILAKEIKNIADENTMHNIKIWNINGEEIVLAVKKV